MIELDKGVFGITPGSTTYKAEAYFNGGSISMTGLVVGIDRDPQGDLMVQTWEEGDDGVLRSNRYPIEAFLNGKSGIATITPDSDVDGQKPPDLSGFVKVDRLASRLKAGL